MIGIVSNRQSAADYDDDMQRAKAIGIDAFALNIGVDPYTDAQLALAYESAANNDMKVFISFDFNWYKDTSDASRVGQMAAKYGALPAQLKVDGKVFISSFAGDALDVATVRASAGVDLYVAPNFHPGMGDFDQLDGALNWMGWPSDGNNKAPKDGKEVTVEAGDKEYLQTLNGKGYIAPVSPWFSTHFGSEVPYSKNWVFPGDLLWYNRWNEILDLKPNFIEIVTWNDYGESHYIGPLHSPHTDDGGSKWVNDMPHGGWLDMAIPYIKAYKAGSTDVSQFITEDQVIYWYRRTPKDVNCDATDTTMGPADNTTGNYFEGRPDGFEIMNDSVFVVPLLTAAGQVSVNSGGTLYTFDAPAGASSFEVPMGLGTQAFALSRGGSEVLSEVSLMPITDECPCGIYNFNAYVGTVPAPKTVDSLQTVALQMFSNGLKAACDPTPTLAAAQPPATAAPTATSTVAGGAPAPTSPPTTAEPSPPVTTAIPTEPSPPVTTSDAPAPTSTEPAPAPSESCLMPEPAESGKPKRRVLSIGRFHIEIDDE
ncbi:glucan endo-1,3-alpha-glucosidase agn1 precursor [Exidia glandulosa HHB12029]|uniref:Glucan endo-1,3-alpha-glucosidase agn1 n=1 Tax=Exidia glandulosa HHB12029 TaxID=1314781 RepID=A0A165HAG0_EXIGL|nr:glucan endo-1,3-alpha-glucosidase agn1 precursor [Exidia glandulosa HHB12029]